MPIIQPSYPLKDHHIDWRPGRAYWDLTMQNATNLLGGATLAAMTSATIVGVLCATANAGVAGVRALPNDVDVTKDIHFYVHWNSEAAAVGARTITWKILYTALVPNTTAFAAAPATALDGLFSAQAPKGTANTYQVTPEGSQGIIKGGTLDVNVYGFAYEVVMGAFNAAFTENKYLLGLEIVYSPRRTQGPDGLLHEAQRPTNQLGWTF